MANYYLDVNCISRNQQRSAAAASAYRSGEKLHDDYYGLTHDYTHRTDVLYSNIFLTPSAPGEFRDRQTFVNAIEKAEKRIDARLLREVRGSLPNELTLEEHIELVKEYVAIFVDRGMCADVSIHEGKSLDDPGKNNPHFHMLLPTRPAGPDGFNAKKNRDWNKRENIIFWREQWARIQNRAYERKGLDVRVSHESLVIQGIDREPAIYLSRADWQREKRGIRTPHGDENRAIKVRNKEREERQRLQNREQNRVRSRAR